LTQKNLESYPDVFADTVNALMYDGRQVVKEEKLVPAPTESIYEDGEKLRNQFQDVGMYVMDNENIETQYMLENQTKKDSLMAVREAGYQGAVYRRQYDTKSPETTFPVIGAVLYWGDTPWKNNRSLKEMYIKNGKSPETMKYVNDVMLHIYEMAHLSREVREGFHSDMRVVVDILAEGKDYNYRNCRMKHTPAVMRFLKALTSDVRFDEMAKYSEEKGEDKMCELLDYVENRGIARGEARGEKRGIEIGESRGEKRGIEIGEESTIILNIKNLSETLKLTVDQAMDALKVPEDKRDYYRKAVQ
jgi:hypothetical protein